MTIDSNVKRVSCENGVICSLPHDFLGYFGWPSVDRLEDNTLVAVASGYRNDHICPFGRTVFSASSDDGQTWTIPRVINDSPLDDRDAGIIGLGGKNILVTWFTTNRRPDYESTMQKRVAALDAVQRERWLTMVKPITPEIEQHFTGSWAILSTDGGATWKVVSRPPVSAPHGCIRLRNGDLFYLGKLFRGFQSREEFISGPIAAARSKDNGHSWQLAGSVEAPIGAYNSNCHEPHVVQLPSSKLLGFVRVQNSPEFKVTQSGYTSFSMFTTESVDGGLTWTQMKSIGFFGSPPHIFRHTSGALVLSYGYRRQPFGERIAISYNEGATWDHDWIIRDDGPDGDLGYPCSVELSDGSIFTVYYQKPTMINEQCALLWSRWRLPV